MDPDVFSKPHKLKFDVFLSFRGSDTRNTITKHLYEALHREVRVFRDNEGMERGDGITSSLVEAIEETAASVIVFSSNYASSPWCLSELALLCELKTSLKRPMIPIFYDVDPSHVRKQSDHFVKDFEEHSKRFGEEKIERWREALKLVGNLPGFVWKKHSADDVAMIELVVKRVLAELSNTTQRVGEYTVGMESRVDDLMNLFDINSSSGVQVLGLYGVGGIGKTTLSEAFYKKIVGNFRHRVFIKNVRERSSDQGGLVNLQKEFMNALTSSRPQIEDFDSGREKIKEHVLEKKILAVLDDVDNIDQVDALVGETGWYGEGSLIVITTRDEEILSRLSVNQKYEVKCLTEEQALKLFSYHSLRKEKPTESLLELSKKIVQILGFLPLAVEVFGSLLYDKKEVKEWQIQLEKLKNTQPDNLQDVLALSFESLYDEEKKVFLDIACLFLRMRITKEEVVEVLKGCGFNAEAALSVLRQKSLVKIFADDTLWMHDQIRDMGRQMDVTEIPGDLRTRSRLWEWDRPEIMNLLNNMKGTSSIQGIVFDFSKKAAWDPSAEDIALRNLQNNPGIKSLYSYLKNKFIPFREEKKPKSSEITIQVESFVPMNKLRLLQINHVNLEGNLKLLPSELKWIQWKGCPLENLPPDFLAGQLAVLDLSESRIRRIQSMHSKGVDENLKVLNLRGCHSLEAVPDLSNHKALEKLVLERCNLLVKVPRSVGNLKTLLQLDLRNCSNLSEFLVDVSGLKRLEKLFLSGCSNLSVLPENIGAMSCLIELLLDGTAIKKLPESIYRLKSLEKLSLKVCRSIKELPLCIGALTSLEELYLDDTALQNLPSSIGYLKNLQKLHLMHCASLSKIPDTINELKSLKELYVNGSAVEELPLNPGSLQCLIDFSAGGCNFLKQIPSSIGGLSSLLQLQLDRTPIETLPEEIGALHFIRKLELRNCKSLKFLPESIRDMDTLHSLYLEGSNIEKLPEDFGKLENLIVLQMNNCKMLKRLPESFGDLKSLHHLFMQETLVVELPDSFGNLSNLRVLKMLKKPLFRCYESEEPHFEELPNSFSNLSLLEELDARSCGISGKIPDVFEKMSSVKILNLGNNYFHSLPSSLKGLLDLKELSLYDCRELKCLPPLPWKLEQLNLANCFSLESISDLSALKILHDLNLTNCEKLVNIPGLEKLTALKRLFMSGCNSSCSLAVQKRLSNVSLKMLWSLSLPGNRVPDWFSQGPVTFPAQPNRELRGVILAVVVAMNHESKDDYQLPHVLDIQAQILKLGLPLYTHTLHLSGVPRTSNDQLHIFRYSALHPMVMTMKDGYTIQVIKRNPPIKQGVELKMHGIHLIYEGDDDDITGKENILTEAHQTVSQKLAHFFSSFKGETSSEGEANIAIFAGKSNTTVLNTRSPNDDWYSFREFLNDRLSPLTLSGCKAEDAVDFLREQQISGDSKILAGRIGAACEAFGIKAKDNPFHSLSVITYLKEAKQMTREAKCVAVFSCNDNIDVDETHFIDAILKELHKRDVTPFTYDLSSRENLDLEKLYRSSVGIMVVSNSFARSSNSLDHLVAIMKHQRETGLVIIPTFFKVPRADICGLEGKFDAAFLQYHNSAQADRVHKWWAAMIEIPSTDGNEWTKGTQFTPAEEVVKNACLRLQFQNSNNLVRILGLLNHPQPSDVEIEGIWGMAGIGKTSVAREIFKTLAPQYDVCYFLQDFHVKCKKKGLRQIRGDFFCEVFGEKNLSISACDTKQSFMRDWFRNKAILIVLDDVSNARNAEYVVGGFDWFSHGHRIILTSRRKQVLLQCKVKGPYEIQKLCDADSIRLCKQYLNGESAVISELVSCSSGIPLVLEVLGSSVSKQPIANMKEHLRSLRRNPPPKIQKAFQRSFDGLNENQKNIFLDLACFFRGEKKEHVVQILDACGFFTSLGICDLIDESLISLLDNRIEIPIPYQDIGRFIVQKEDKYPYERSRLWDSTDIANVLTKNSGTKAIEEDEATGSEKVETILLRIVDDGWPKRECQEIRLVRGPAEESIAVALGLVTGH